MKRKMSFLVAGLLCLSLCLGAEAAGTVTDTLTVRVGYYGMEQDRYVEVATYHWSELYDALPLHYEAYSFFRSTDDGTYNTVIDSAYGFYLADLLDYAGIYSGDIAVVAFYTRDQSVGCFTSFTYADLFGTQRYYYNDLSAHISPVYDDIRAEGDADEQVDDERDERAVCADGGDGNGLVRAGEVADNGNVGGVEQLFQNGCCGDRQGKLRQLAPDWTMEHVEPLAFCGSHVEFLLSIQKHLDCGPSIAQTFPRRKHFSNFPKTLEGDLRLII